MTHSPTPDEAPYTPGVSELVEGYAQGAEGWTGFADRVERRREAMRTIAQAKVDAVAEYKAQVFDRRAVIGDLASIWGYETVPAIAGQAVDDLIQRMTARGAR